MRNTILVWFCFVPLLTPICFAQPADNLESQSNARLRVEAERAIVDGKHEVATQLLEKITKQNPTDATAFYHLGREAFCAGEIARSLAAFDRFLELAPNRKTSLWERGITCYYAKKFDQGRKQFELYQTYHSQDVENGVWHILCKSGITGFEKAATKSLNIKSDTRVPMMEIYDLFRQKADPQDVIKAANADAPKTQLNRQKFYANLYVGLYYEATGDEKKATEHLQAAVKHRIGHYMWDVARVHLEVRKREQEQAKD